MELRRDRAEFLCGQLSYWSYREAAQYILDSIKLVLFVSHIYYSREMRRVLLAAMAIATQQPDVSAYTGIYQMRCTAYKVAPDDGLI